MSVIIINNCLSNTYFFQKLLIVFLTLQLIFPIESHDNKREEEGK